MSAIEELRISDRTGLRISPTGTGESNWEPVDPEDPDRELPELVTWNETHPPDVAVTVTVDVDIVRPVLLSEDQFGNLKLGLPQIGMPMIEGRWYDGYGEVLPVPVDKYALGYGQLVEGTIYAVPFFNPARRLFGSIGFYLHVAEASKMARAGVYTTLENGLPGVLLDQTPDLSLGGDPLGHDSAVTDVILGPDMPLPFGWHYLVLQTNSQGTARVECIDYANSWAGSPSGAFSAFGRNSMSAVNIYGNHIEVDALYDAVNGLPDTFPSTGIAFKDGYRPALYLQAGVLG